MRKLITAIACMFFMTAASAQIEYPRFAKDSLGQIIVEMTIEQAQKLDNNSDMLELFQELNMQLENYDSVCVKVVNDKDIVISELKVEVGKLKELASNKDAEIALMQQQIADYILREVLYNQQISNLEQIAKEKDKQIRQAKTKTIITGTIFGTVVAGLLAGLIYAVAK